MLVNAKTILDKAHKEHYAILAPNICNELTARAAILAGVDNNAPIILDAVLSSNPNIKLLTKIVREMANSVDIPVAINLDYCSSYDDAMFALKNGFTSVSLDCSNKPLSQGIREMAEIVETAHALNASTEGQLGIVRRVGENVDVDDLTNVDEVKDFIKKTDIDILSISIGNSRGHYKKMPTLNFDLLNRINAIADVPLCLHGCSYIGDDNLVKLVKNGICKVNMSTELYDYANREVVKKISKVNRPYEVFDIYSEAYKEIVSKYINLLKQNNRT